MAAVNRPEGPTLTSDLSALDSVSLDKAVSRAWREASRCWSEYRAEPNRSPIKHMLLTSAEAAEEWWETLNDEARDRLDIVEVRSVDVYVTTDEPYYRLDDPQPKAPAKPIVESPSTATSPWVTRAIEKTLPTKDLS